MKIPAAVYNLDPRKLHVETVRAALGTTTGVAEWILSLAARAGFLEKRVEALSPFTKRAVTVARSEAELPETVICYRPEGIDEEEVEVRVSDMQKLTYYRLVDEAARRLEDAQSRAA